MRTRVLFMKIHVMSTSPSFAASAGAVRATPFSGAQFRAALGRFATGVTIVTARAPGGAGVGVTANSFNSVSLQPPLVLWSLARDAGSLAVFEACSHYAINVLAADQKSLAQRFAQKGERRFDDLVFSSGWGGAPVFDGVVASFECANRSRYHEGDHVIFVGEVVACQHRADNKPLLFHGGAFFTELPL